MRIDVRRMVRQGVIVPVGRASGTISWANSQAGRRGGTIGYLAETWGEGGRLRLTYTTTDSRTGERHEADYWVTLEATLQRLGGRRWWFRCPRTGLRAAILYLPSWGRVFACREAYRLAYRVQRETTADRHIRRAFKIRRRLGDEGAIGDYVVKPPWMRWATFDREMEKLDAAEDDCNGNLLALLERLKGLAA